MTDFCQKRSVDIAAVALFQELKEFKERFNYQKQAVKSTMSGVSKDQDEGPWPELSSAYNVLPFAKNHRSLQNQSHRVIGSQRP